MKVLYYFGENASTRINSLYTLEELESLIEIQNPYYFQDFIQSNEIEQEKHIELQDCYFKCVYYEIPEKYDDVILNLLNDFEEFNGNIDDII